MGWAWSTETERIAKKRYGDDGTKVLMCIVPCLFLGGSSETYPIRPFGALADTIWGFSPSTRIHSHRGVPGPVSLRLWCVAGCPHRPMYLRSQFAHQI